METHTFRVKTGLSFTTNADLLVSRDEVRLENKVLSADQIEWITFEIVKMYNTFVPTGTHSEFKIGGRDTILKFRASDLFSGKKQTEAFREAADLILALHGPKIVARIVGNLAQGGTHQIGRVRFTREGAVLSKEVFGFFEGQAKIIAYSSLHAEVGSGQVALRHKSDKAYQAFFDISTVRNACFIPSIVQFLST